ncbi:DUF2891 domain-containing protein [Winogradskyella echinorum]|uniref:DUF2891 domain-containing protein n=1 Tax=Winogradskyella echinorum TaxID=538189 RepID=A0ABR6Y0D1_9FLAO|nr:DUF2891 domain-containing protein [Winogradskyella echinorum]MBC3846173.1 DUF2891 domain-containing protein [Winogradskyella echinorum]MBC5750521.1 DUF2891 domain-containing protein [Winogradskyella echinorum]
MKTRYLILFLCIVNLSCNSEKDKKTEISTAQIEKVAKPTLNLEQANRLAELPLACVGTEYPNKLGQTLGGDEDLKSPKELHPTFYGCFDWHSAVHGHWSLVSLLRQFPELDKKVEIINFLTNSISKENIEQELLYFDGVHNKSFERTYGWAWLLKLAEELHFWDNKVARELEANLQPLTDLIVDKYLEFLPKLYYPIRVGEHPNTAFGLSFAYDYAVTVGNTELKSLIEQRAKDFYGNDKSCPISWEPSGFDFLSPCLEEAALMKRVLSKDEFKVWAVDFLPQLKDKTFVMETGKVSDRSDGKLVHLDGVNFSRAWSLNYIANNLPAYAHLKNVANQHINYSLPSIVGDSYEGGHWLGSFAIYALNSIEE